MERTLLPVSILCTRALGNGARHFIHQQDWQVDIVSFIETRGTITVDQINDLLLDIQLLGPDVVLVFSSEKGVKWLKWGLDKYGFTLPAGIKAVCVGENTEKVLADFGIECMLTQNDASTLLSTLPIVVPVGVSFLFLCGNMRLPILPDGIKAAGFPIKEYIIYETQLTPHKLLGPYDVVLFFSPSGVESFFMVNTWDQSMVAVSIGPTTFAALQNAGVQKVLVADYPSEISMLEVCKNYLKERL